jgi:WD40 repeat protein
MPSQNIFMSVVEYGPIRLWDLATGRERFTVTTETNLRGPPLLRMAPDGSWVLTVLPNATGEFQLREVETGHLRWSSTVTNGAGHLTVSPIVSPDGRWIACGGSSFDKTRVISAATGEVQTPLGNAWPVAFSRNGDVVAAVTHSTADASSPTVVTLWDTGTGRAGRRIASSQPDPGSIALSPDGRWLAVGPPGPGILTPETASIELWDLRTEAPATNLRFDLPAKCGLDELEFSPDSAILVQRLFGFAGSWAWQLKTSPLRPIHLECHGPLGSSRLLFSADGTRFIEPAADQGRIVFRTTANPDEIIATVSLAHSFFQADFAPDGRSLAVVQPVVHREFWRKYWDQYQSWRGRLPPDLGQSQNELLIFNAQTGAVTGYLPDLGPFVDLLGFTPDGKSLWTRSFVAAPAMLTDGSDGMVSAPDGILRVQQWAVPNLWPPAWLLAVTSLAIALVVFDWRRGRRIARATP